MHRKEYACLEDAGILAPNRFDNLKCRIGFCRNEQICRTEKNNVELSSDELGRRTTLSPTYDVFMVCEQKRGSTGGINGLRG